MAVVPELPGLEVTVEVEGESLAEYEYQPQHDLQDVAATNVVSRHVEAPSGEAFAIRTSYKPPYDPTSSVHVDIVLDGNYILAPLEEWAGKDNCQGYKYAKSTSIVEGVSSTQTFRFGDFKPEENDETITAEVKQKVSEIGQITLYLYYIEDLTEAKPAEIPRSSLGQSEVVSHKAVKQTVTAGDSLAYQTCPEGFPLIAHGLSVPEVATRLTFNEVKTATNEPFAAFTFYYRSTAALKSLGMIERTPSPSPEPEPEPKDPNDMSMEEMRAELLRNRQQEQQQRVKREREDSVATAVGDEDEEVQYLDTRLAKRQRRSLGEADEVVDVEG